MKKLIFIMLALVCFTACTNDDEDGLENNTGTTVTREDEGRAVELNDTTLTLYPDTDKDTVNVGAEKGWWIEEIATDKATVKPTAEEKQLMAEGGAYDATCDWISVKRAGSGIEVAVGMTDRAERTCRLTLATEDTTATVTVVQSDWLTGFTTPINLSPNSVTLPSGGGTQICTTDENAKWTIDYVKIDETQYNSTLQEKEECGRTHAFDKTYEWLTVKREGSKLIVTAETNDTGMERTFEVYLFGGDTYSILTGKQETMLTGGGTPINLSPTSVTMPAGGGTQTCTTDEGVNWVINDITVDGNIYCTTLQEKNECIDTGTFENTYEWLTVKRDGNKLIVTTEPNTTGKERTFNIQLTAGNTGATLKGTQPAE